MESRVLTSLKNVGGETDAWPRGQDVTALSPPSYQLHPQLCSPASFPDGLPRGPDEAAEELAVSRTHLSN